MSFCINQEHKCKFKSREQCGGYCWIHRKQYLITDKLLRLDRFTHNSKDYTIKELEYLYKSIYGKKNKLASKEEYFKHIQELNERYKNQSIIKLQSLARRYIINKMIKLRGIGYICRHVCKNDEDFYTYESKDNIESIFFFSYKDINNNIWCFDIRSLKKLIDMNYNNPYTTEPIPVEIKEKINYLINKLKENKIKISIQDDIIRDRKTTIKQKYVDIISHFELNTGYICEINWILSMNISQLKALYRTWEDIWNYRAYLPDYMKKSISPPNGILFPYNVSEINNFPNNIVSKYNLLDIISLQLSKIMGCTNSSNSSLGFMYFIIALSSVNSGCYQIHGSWVNLAISE